MFPKACWISALVLVSAEAFMPAATSGRMLAALRQYRSPPHRLDLVTAGNRKFARNVQLRASGVPSGEEPMSLTAYDQLVLSVRALTPSEIKQELNTRGISHSDCFEKEELVMRLVEARLQIAAEAIGEGEIKVGEEDTLEVPEKENASAEEEKETKVKRDGRVFNEDVMKLLDKEKLEAMLQDQELMRALRNPAVLKMAQDVLKDPTAMDKYSGDPDVMAAIQKVKDFLKASGASS